MKNKKYIWIAGFCLIVLLMIFINHDTKTDISIGEYKDIDITIDKTIVRDIDITNALMNSIIEKQEDVNITNRAVRNGDIANINYAGKVDGVAFEGGTYSGYDLLIGSGSFIDNFEEQIIGMNIGDTKEIKVNFPDPYTQNTELSGKEAIFTVKINSIKGKEIPREITDDMIKKISDKYTTVEEYKVYVKEELDKQAIEKDELKKEQAIWKIVTDNVKVNSLSSKKKNYYANIFQDSYSNYAQMYGVELSEFIVSYMGTTVEAFNKSKQDYAEEFTLKYGIAAVISKQENISVTDEEYSSYIKENGIDVDSEKFFKESAMDELLYRKVIKFLISNSNITINNI